MLNSKTLLPLALFAWLGAAAPAQAQATLDQRRPQVYAMGVNFGITSYISSALACCQHLRSTQMIRGAQDGLTNVTIDLVAINSSAGAPQDFLPFHEVQQLKTEYSSMASADDSCLRAVVCAVLGIGGGSAKLSRLFEQLVSLRDGITARFAKLSKPLTDTYVLGVNVGIAEGHATMGEPGRQVVFSSLMNAKAAAQQLGLDLSPLDACITLASGTTPMAEVHQRIISMRATYQSSL